MSLGDHIRQRRLDLKLEQKDVAQILQASENTIWQWEMGRSELMFRYYPVIMEFLGYCPWGPLQTWGARLDRYRMNLGLSLEKFARELGVDPETLARRLKKGPTASFKKKLMERMKS